MLRTTSTPSRTTASLTVATWRLPPNLAELASRSSLAEITGSLLIFLAISRISGSFSLKVCTSSRIDFRHVGQVLGLG